jgi:hypothetical protein
VINRKRALKVSLEKRYRDAGVLDQVLIALVPVVAIDVEWPFSHGGDGS